MPAAPVRQGSGTKKRQLSQVSLESNEDAFHKRNTRRSKVARVLATELEVLNTGSIELLESQLHEVYVWIDQVSISKPKKNLNRDFSDCSCIAEVINHYLPTLKLKVRDYPPTNSIKESKANWLRLN